MSRSFLARFRGADARSLARALAVLLAFNAVFGAFHSGGVAQGAAADAVLCVTGGSVSADGGLPWRPARADDLACCVLGCGPLAAALAAPAGPLPAIALAASMAGWPLLDASTHEPRHSGAASPRGPPILA